MGILNSACPKMSSWPSFANLYHLRTSPISGELHPFSCSDLLDSSLSLKLRESIWFIAEPGYFQSGRKCYYQLLLDNCLKLELSKAKQLCDTYSYPHPSPPEILAVSSELVPHLPISQHCHDYNFASSSRHCLIFGFCSNFLTGFPVSKTLLSCPGSVPPKLCVPVLLGWGFFNVSAPSLLGSQAVLYPWYLLGGRVLPFS